MDLLIETINLGVSTSIETLRTTDQDKTPGLLGDILNECCKEHIENFFFFFFTHHLTHFGSENVLHTRTLLSN